MVEAINTDTGNSQSTDSTPSTNFGNPNNDVNEKMLKFLNSRMSMARRFRCEVN